MSSKDPVLNIPSNFHEEEELAVLKNSDDVARLREILDEGEVVYRLALGFQNQSDGVLAATNKRIVFVDKKFIGSTVQSYEYSEVAAIAVKKELMTHTMTFLHSTRPMTITDIEKEHGDRFLQFVGESIGQDYTSEANGHIFKHNEELINLDDVPSMQDDIEESI